MNQLADRELDAKVARFMGWATNPHEDGWRSADGQSKHWPGPPYFSTEIKAAMEVVEKLRVNHGVIINTHKKGAWHVCFGATNHPGEATNESLPRAICEAALAAIETK